eukprot:TRINITY_DN94194_c0_g1_i1.p1 TRINITY_DN94194_c0_g1~~TRINITY_DN94194_c0_g1_i1.p1  ORF type:complete len:260 (+),score=26.90 TRINITY_DN94194_c0_g1_i1:120-899(+)
MFRKKYRLGFSGATASRSPIATSSGSTGECAAGTSREDVPTLGSAARENNSNSCSRSLSAPSSTLSSSGSDRYIAAQSPIDASSFRSPQLVAQQGLVPGRVQDRCAERKTNNELIRNLVEQSRAGKEILKSNWPAGGFAGGSTGSASRNAAAAAAKADRDAEAKQAEEWHFVSASDSSGSDRAGQLGLEYLKLDRMRMAPQKRMSPQKQDLASLMEPLRTVEMALAAQGEHLVDAAREWCASKCKTTNLPSAISSKLSL